MFLGLQTVLYFLYFQYYGKWWVIVQVEGARAECREGRFVKQCLKSALIVVFVTCVVDPGGLLRKQTLSGSPRCKTTSCRDT